MLYSHRTIILKYWDSPAESPTKSLPSSKVSTDRITSLKTNSRPAKKPRIWLTIRPPRLPSESAMEEPPNDPMAPPTKNIETMEDHNKSN